MKPLTLNEEIEKVLCDHLNCDHCDVAVALGRIMPLIAAHLEAAARCQQAYDGAICGCKLDCHLHDWRQKDFLAPFLEEVALKVEDSRGVSFEGDEAVFRAWNGAIERAASLIRKSAETLEIKSN